MKPDDASLASGPPPAVGVEAGESFRSLLLAAAWRVISQAHEVLGGDEAVAERFPFLIGYAQAFEETEMLLHAPLAELSQAAGWPAIALEVWLVAGLVEEDARFGAVFEAIDPEASERRPSLALMQSWWGTLPREGLRPALRTLTDLGLLRPAVAGASRAETVYEVEDNCWATARGEPPAKPWPGVRLAEADEAPVLEALIPGSAPRRETMLLPEAIHARLMALTPRLIEEGGSLVMRGAEHNGRGSVLSALARRENRRALFIDWPLPSSPAPSSEAPPWLGAFASLAQARPILRLKPTPGERMRLPVLEGYSGWIGIVCGEEEAIVDLPPPAWSLRLPLPDIPLRTALIETHGHPPLQARAGDLAGLVHFSTGHLVRALRQHGAGGSGDDAAALAAGLREVALAGGSAELDSLARRLDTGIGYDWNQLVVDGELHRELYALESRCRQRDRLREVLPPGFAARLGPGVRALFAGPSGTGKTLAAVVLASKLGVPLYRLDLSAVVSKYIGETERNLHRVLSAAESLDIMLLLDEGDSLLAKRTEVGNAHDRYANLETNFLLQRLENHRGLVVVTTNALDHIDTAFLRRFDALLNFRPPEFAERLALWHSHLPATHDVPPGTLERIAEYCALSGGQVRTIVLAASSTALSWSRPVDESVLMDAIRREYRRNGNLFPLGG